MLWTPNKNKIRVSVIALLGAVICLATFFYASQLLHTEQEESTNQSSAFLLTQSSRNEERQRIQADFNSLTTQQAYDAFKKRNKNNGNDIQHDYAHIFGQELYEQMGVPGVAICDATFAFGCYHSFFGMALMENGLDIITDLEKACIQAHGIKGLGCQHGIGHGVLAEVGEERLMEALEACMQLAWKGPLGGCMSGVYMEYNLKTMDNVAARELDPDNPHYPCTEVGKLFSEACYFELPQWWVMAYHTQLQNMHSDSETGAFNYAGQNCSGVLVEADKTACFRGLGNVIGGHYKFSVEQIKDYCTTSSGSDGTIHCLEGAAWLLSWEPDYKDTWENLCSDLTGESLRICLSSKDMI